ncbi:MAG TPA: nicotinate (nicotinamide) nucleotide adenylyltransferase [Polyangia bacterium]|jgi:nicotinate-nucleotide adenylyltransferase
MTTAFFGGSFDPPHVAHQMACLYALATQAVDRVLWVPVYQHHFAKTLTPFADRLEMSRRAAAPFGAAVEVSAVEEQLGAPSLTLNTLRHLMAERPGERFALVIGSDILPERAKWYGWDEIASLCDLIVVGRGGHSAPDAPRLELPRVSSTEVRAAIAAGGDVSALVPRAVLDYIHARGLYGAPRREPDGG